MYCRFCGAQLRDGALFCTSCGKRSPDRASAAGASANNTSASAPVTYTPPAAEPTSYSTGPSWTAAPTTPYPNPTAYTNPAAYPSRAAIPTPAPKKTHSDLTMHPRRLLIIVIAMIIGVGLFSFFLGAIMPAEPSDSYASSVTETFGDYEETVKRYFVMAYLDDEEGAREVFCPSLREDDLAEHGWFPLEDEGAAYEISKVYQYYDHVCSLMSVELGEQVDCALDVETTVEYSDGRDDQIVDVVLVSIDGTWYVYEIM